MHVNVYTCRGGRFNNRTDNLRAVCNIVAESMLFVRYVSVYILGNMGSKHVDEEGCGCVCACACMHVVCMHVQGVCVQGVWCYHG